MCYTYDCASIFSRDYCFFFYTYSDHRDLHSFPTRRSSDLRDTESSGRPDSFRPSPISAAAQLLQSPSPPVLLSRPRSEEHTSELQSRRDLVCRLLLEKKNNAVHILSCRYH